MIFFFMACLLACGSVLVVGRTPASIIHVAQGTSRFSAVSHHVWAELHIELIYLIVYGCRFHWRNRVAEYIAVMDGDGVVKVEHHFRKVINAADSSIRPLLAGALESLGYIVVRDEP
jgi:hypothetical protein